MDGPSFPPRIELQTGPRVIYFIGVYLGFSAFKFVSIPRFPLVILSWTIYYIGLFYPGADLFHLAFSKDPLRNKILVWTVFSLEIVQTVLMTESAFHVFATRYGDFASYNDVDKAWFSMPIITGLVAFIAEGFYAYRIKVLAQSYWMAGIIGFLAIVQLAGAIAAGVVLKHAQLFSQVLGRSYSISAGIWNGGSAACDIIIAVCMTYYLTWRGAASMQGTHVRIRRVIKLVIETGTITAATATLNLIFTTLPDQPAYYLVTSHILAKIYSNSMMVVLNSRIRIGLESSSGDCSSDAMGQSISIGNRMRPGRGRGASVLSTGPSIVGIDGSLSPQRHRRGQSGRVHILSTEVDSYELQNGVIVSREEVTYPSRTSIDENRQDETKEDISKNTGLV